MYREMTGGQLAEACGDDAAKWAAAFQEIVVERKDLALDEDLMITWFANAIEAATRKRGVVRAAGADGITAELVQDSADPTVYRVEAVDGDGGCELAIFSGPGALDRAIAFAGGGYFQTWADPQGLATPEAPAPIETVEEFCARVYSEVGVTPALRRAYELYRAAFGRGT